VALSLPTGKDTLHENIHAHKDCLQIPFLKGIKNKKYTIKDNETIV